MRDIRFADDEEITTEEFLFGYYYSKKGRVELEIVQAPEGNWVATAYYRTGEADTWSEFNTFGQACQFCHYMARKAGKFLYQIQERNYVTPKETLEKETHLTKKEIEKYITNGTSFYTNDSAGYEEYKQELLGAVGMKKTFRKLGKT